MLAEILSTLALVVGVAVTLATWIKHHKLRQILNKIPGSDGLPFIGDSLHLKSDSLGEFT
jgi:hypothetical protein